MTKVCRICRVEKELKDFYPNKQCSLGVTGTCRSCSRVRINSWYKENEQRRRQVANDFNRSRKLQAIEFFGGKCHDCGGSFPPCVYAFHHLDPSQKDYNPSHAISKKPSVMWKELEKCIMLCANCHMIRHHGNGDTT